MSRLDSLTRFDVDKAASFMIDWCCAFSGGWSRHHQNVGALRAYY